MKLKYQFVVNEVAGQLLAVPVGEGLNDFNGFLKMNDVGAAILKQLVDETTEEQVIAEMAKQYPDASMEEVTENVQGFLAKLQEVDLLA